MPKFKLVKRNKKLIIVDDKDELVYCPPSFLLPVTSRADYQPLLDQLNTTGDLGGEVLTAFETKFNPRLKHAGNSLRENSQ